jgi:hypothetical protein
MKKLTIFVILIALFAISASALSVGSPKLGSENQDRVKNVATTFTVTNNNTVAMTGVTFSFGGGAENTKYLLSVSGPSSIGASSSAQYTLNGTVPLDHPGIDPASFEEKEVKIGTFTVTGTVGSSTDSASSDVTMQAVNQLKIKKARIECDTKSQSLDDGDRVKNLKPGDDCTLEIEVENEFDDNDNSNQKIGDIAFDNIDTTVDSSDGDIDVNEDDDLEDLDANDEDAITVDLEIDEEADDGTVTIDIKVTGKDENGALHGESMDVRLEIERLSHDLQIRRMEVSPAAVSNCEATRSKLTVNILNQGKRDEDDVVVEATIGDLQFSQKIENIELDKDDSTSVAFDITVPKDAKDGIVRVDVKTYFDSVAPSNSGSVELNINECSEDADEPVTPVMDDKKQTTAVVAQTAPVIPQGQAQAAPRKQSSFTDSKAYVALLVVLSILIAGAIVALVVVMSRKKRVD